MAYFVLDVHFEEMPDRVVLREVGYMSALKDEGMPIKDYVYVPERTCRRIVKGKRYGFDKQVCSECGYGIGDVRWLFCPKCGARIEEG